MQPNPNGNKKAPWNKGKTKIDFSQLSKSGVKKGNKPWNKGKRMTDEYKKNNPHLLNPPSFKGKKRSQEWINKHLGNKNSAWKGGITPINFKIRKSLEYSIWRKSVFERDNYTCIWCGDNKGNNLNADHIKPFALFPELRFAIDNGRTLCKKCHITTKTYGGRTKKT